MLDQLPILGLLRVDLQSDSFVADVFDFVDAMRLRPVTLPPGRARLATSPAPSGSPATAKTIGMVEVACLAARVGGVA